MNPKPYGHIVPALPASGTAFAAGVFDERQVRVAAGLTLAAGAVAFAYAALARVYLPIQVVTSLFFVEFAIRVAAGLQYSPFGVLSRLLTRGQLPEWVSAKPKRFAWSLGLVMSFAMMLITNAGIRGSLPLGICLVCLVLMWLEAVLGLCLGCEIYAALRRRGWIGRDPAIEVCSNGACAGDGRADRRS